MDALTEILHSVRLRSTVFCRAEVTAPWDVHTTGIPGAGIFHAVVRGRCWIRLDGDDQAHALSSGDVALLPRGSAHTMSDDPATPALPIRDLVTPSDGGTDLLETGGGGSKTSILCGRFDFESSTTHPLFALLPNIVVVRADSNELAEWLPTTLRLMASELESQRQGVNVILTRLADVLMVHALRVYIATATQDNLGWLRGLRDPQVAYALGLIHKTPNQAWTAALLGNKVGMSRSALFVRFSDLVGEPPARYLTRWRMHVAARALRRETITLSEIAERVGYASEGAFSKAFKRFTGTAPGQYRRQAA